jgi:predicted MFS family arabinose efflux permease
VFVCAVGGFTALGAYFAYDTVVRAQRQALESRFDLAAQRIVATAQRALSYGIALPAQTRLGALLEREVSRDPSLQRIDIIGDTGQVLFSSQQSKPAGEAPSGEASRAVKRPLLDDLGQPLAQVQVWYPTRLHDDPRRRMGEHLARLGAAAAAAACVVTLVGGLLLGCWLPLAAPRIRAGGDLGWAVRLRLGFRGGMSLLATGVLALALAAVGWQAQRIGEAETSPQFQEKAHSLARASASLVELALEVGVSLQQLQGVEAHFASLRSESPEIASIQLVDLEGRVLHQEPVGLGRISDQPVSEEVMLAGSTVARVEVQVDRQLVGQLLRATLIDVGFLAVVSLLVALETMALFVGSSALRERGPATDLGSAARVRPPLFLFMLAEELTRPFLPGHARSLAAQGVYADVLGSLPLVVALAVVALCQVPFSSLSLRLGRREGFVAGALLAAAGFVVAALAHELEWLVAARAVGAAGFALVFVSAQGQVIDTAGAGDRARSLAVFARAIMVAAVCGPPLGGMMFDRWGASTVFMICALLSLVAMAAATSSLPRRSASPEPGGNLALDGLRTAWRSPGLPSLLLGCALPAKLMLAAVTFYLVPLGLHQQGWSSTEIGRVLLVYPLVMVVAVPLFASLADRLRQRRTFVIAGALLAGGSCLLLVLGPQTPLIVSLLVVLGLGQGLSMTPQSAMVAEAAESGGRGAVASAMGLFRLIERSGSAMGPALGAVLLGPLGFGVAVMSVGMVGIAGGLVYAWATHGLARPQDGLLNHRPNS